MKVLWICNFMLPAVAEHLGYKSNNKEGWISGLAGVVLRNRGNNDVELAVCSSMPNECFEDNGVSCKGAVDIDGVTLTYYGFKEDTCHPERYTDSLDDSMKYIFDDYKPDIVHIFGTEYGHCLAACRNIDNKGRLLVGIQGLCSVYADSFYADLPGDVISKPSFRDIIKKDNLVTAHDNYVLRGKMEKESLAIAGNITGRTAWDYHYAQQFGPQAKYHVLNETLRSNFYGCVWNEDEAEKHSIFLSQGDYPIKGLHYMLLAMPDILAKYPDAKVYVAGNSILKQDKFLGRIKQSGYAKYINKLIKTNSLQDKIVFLGSLSSEEMKQRYLKSNVFVCCSSIENSANSLGEAMLLGMPCVSARVGGLPSIFDDNIDGEMYEGSSLRENAEGIAKCVIDIWSDANKRKEYCANARAHASRTHNPDENYRRLLEIYLSIEDANRSLETDEQAD